MKDSILFIANIRLPTEKAHGVQIMKMCEAFASVGHPVTLLVPNRRNSITEDPFSYYSVKETFKIKKIFSLDLIHWGKFGFFLQSITFAIGTILVAWGGKDQIIYSRDELVVFLNSFFGRRIFWESHVPKKSFLALRAARRAKGLITISGGLRKFYESLGISAEKIMVAHDAVDLEQFNVKESREECRKRLGLPMEKKIIAYIGKLRTMGKGKGVDQLIDSFLAVKKELASAFLLLVGANTYEIPAVREKLITAGIPSDDFLIIPHVYQKEIPFYERAADVLVMNYPAAEHYSLYMSPLKLFEYLASGTPVVSSDLPVVREVVDEKSLFFVKPDDRESLRSGIIRVLRNAEEAQCIARQALEISRNYTWQSRAKTILAFITTCS